MRNALRGIFLERRNMTKLKRMGQDTWATIIGIAIFISCCAGVFIMIKYVH